MEDGVLMNIGFLKKFLIFKKFYLIEGGRGTAVRDMPKFP